MKYAKVNENHPQAMRLQSIGFVMGTPAKEIKTGSEIMWNFGSTSEVLSIVKETPATLTVLEKCCASGYTATRRLNKNRLVCLLEN